MLEVARAIVAFRPLLVLASRSVSELVTLLATTHS